MYVLCVYLCVDITKTTYVTKPFPIDAVQVKSNGVDMGRFESSSESTFTAFDLHENAVETVTLTSSSGLFEFEGFGLLEVRECVRLTHPNIFATHPRIVDFSRPINIFLHCQVSRPLHSLSLSAGKISLGMRLRWCAQSRLLLYCTTCPGLGGPS